MQDAFSTDAIHEELPTDPAALRALLRQARESLAQQQARPDARRALRELEARSVLEKMREFL